MWCCICLFHHMANPFQSSRTFETPCSSVNRKNNKLCIYFPYATVADHNLHYTRSRFMHMVPKKVPKSLKRLLTALQSFGWWGHKKLSDRNDGIILLHHRGPIKRPALDDRRRKQTEFNIKKSERNSTSSSKAEGFSKFKCPGESFP